MFHNSPARSMYHGLQIYLSESPPVSALGALPGQFTRTTTRPVKRSSGSPDGRSGEHQVKPLSERRRNSAPMVPVAPRKQLAHKQSSLSPFPRQQSTLLNSTTGKALALRNNSRDASPRTSAPPRPRHSLSQIESSPFIFDLDEYLYQTNVHTIPQANQSLFYQIPQAPRHHTIALPSSRTASPRQGVSHDGIPYFNNALGINFWPEESEEEPDDYDFSPLSSYQELPPPSRPLSCVSHAPSSQTS